MDDAIPYEATFSRLVKKLNDNNVLEHVQETVLHQLSDAGFVIDDAAAIDATHVEARDQAPTEKVSKPKSVPKNEGVNRKMNATNG